MAFAGAMLLVPLALGQQQKPLSASTMVQHRTRLYLKDGSYQLVMSYRVQMDRVLYVSAERDGAEEELPLSLVDLDATHRWEKAHQGDTAQTTPDGQAPAPDIDPELLKDEQQRRALSPEVAPDLHLPEQDSVLVLDTFRGTPELVPLTQSSGDLNRATGHSILKGIVNPLSSAHQIVTLDGEKADVQLHVNQPVLFLRVGDQQTVTGSEPFTVDTHGASSMVQDGTKNAGKSRYVIVRADVRRGQRVVASFNISRLGDVRQDEDVIEVTMEPLPGGFWVKLTPKESLPFGEYALMEVISPTEVNLGVWDFGIHPTAPDNADAIKPEPKRPLTLERRGASDSPPD